MTSSDPLNPSSSPERREQTEAFLKEFWKDSAAVGIHGTSWYDIALAAWLAACDHVGGVRRASGGLTGEQWEQIRGDWQYRHSITPDLLDLLIEDRDRLSREVGRLRVKCHEVEGWRL